MTDDNNTRNLAAKYKIQVPQALGSKDTILVIEDQTDLRLIVAHQLQKQSFGAVRQASNGYEALETMKETGTKASAIICDMDMPVMGGLDFLSELRETPELDRGPFCITMDNVSKEKIMLAVESGCDEILVKPFTLADIVPKLRSAFAKFHNPANPEKLYELAKVMLREGKLDDSQRVYRELADAARKSARPVVGLARIEVKRGEHDKALKLLDEAEQRNGHYVHLFVERARIFADRSDWDKAIGMFRQAIDLSPLNPVRYRSAAELLFKVKRYQEASDLLEIALRHKLEFPEVYHFLSQAKFALKDYKAAGKYVRQALAGDPENVSYLNQLGICLKETEQPEEAGKVYNQIIKLDPSNVPALYNKAVLVHAKGDRDEAIKLLERALKKSPDFAEAKAKLEEYRKEGTAA